MTQSCFRNFLKGIEKVHRYQPQQFLKAQQLNTKLTNQARVKLEKPGASEVGKLAGAGENNEGEFGVTEDGKVMGFLHQTAATFREGNLTTGDVIDFADLYSTTGKGQVLGVLLRGLVEC